MRLANELFVGAVFGVIGFAIAAATRRWQFDWGLLWAAMALLAMSFVTPRWSGNLAGLGKPLFVVIAILAVVLVTVTVLRGTGAARTPLPFLTSLLGIYATVPDTEQILALLGVTGFLAMAWRPLGWAEPRGMGAAAMAVLTILAVVSGGRGRESAVVGALGAMAVMGVLAFRRRARTTLAPLLLHLVLVGWWARIAGRADSAGDALVLGLGVTIPVLALCWWLTRGRTHETGSFSAITSTTRSR